MNAEELVRLTDAGPTWCLNLDVIPPASRRAPGFNEFLAGKTQLRVTYSDMESGGRNHYVAKPREAVIVKDDGGDLGSEAAVVGIGEIVANYHNPENPFLKISLKTRIEPGILPSDVKDVPGGGVLYDCLERPTLFEIVE